MSFRTLGGALLSLALCGAPAAAEPVTLLFTGEITDITTGLNGSFGSGDLATWLVTYESDQIPDTETPSATLYGPSALSHFSGTFGSHTVGIDPSRAQQWAITRTSDTGHHAGFAINYYGVSSYAMTGGPIGSLLPWAFFTDFDLAGPISGLPRSADAIGSGTFSLHYLDAGAYEPQHIEGRVTSVQQVPEPGTAALLGIGVAFGFITYRRRRRQL